MLAMMFPNRQAHNAPTHPCAQAPGRQGALVAMALLTIALLGFGCGDNSDPAAPPDAPLSPIADAAPAAADANSTDAPLVDATPAPTAPYLLVGSSRADNVLRFDQATGAFIDELIPAGAGGIDDPDHIAVRGDSIYISGGNIPEQSGIYRYQLSTGAFVEVFAAGGGLHRPYGFASGPDRNNDRCDLFVSDFANGIRRYDSDAALVDSIVTSYTGANTSNFSGSLAFGADGQLFSVGFDSTDGSDNRGVVLRWNGDSGAPMPGMNLTGALLVEDSDPALIRPIGIEAVSP